jgi:hypothetical protein
VQPQCSFASGGKQDSMLDQLCPWCFLPMELVSEWMSKDIEMATARCLSGHWYGGPKADLREAR